jgi:hypothetical protein
LAVQAQVPAAYGVRRRASALEEPRAPQPAIDAQAVVALVGHSQFVSQKQYA